MAPSKRSGLRRKSQSKTGGKRPGRAVAKRPVKKTAKAARPRKPASAPSKKSSLKRKSAARPAAPKVSLAAAPKKKASTSTSTRKAARGASPAAIERALFIASEGPVAAEPVAEAALARVLAASVATIHEAPTLEMAPIEADMRADQPGALTVDELLAADPSEEREVSGEDDGEPFSSPRLIKLD
jgi:hypothetical protein